VEDRLLLLEAQMQNPKWRGTDGSVTISLVTGKSMSDEQFLHLSRYKLVNGWFAFKANKFDPGELPKDNAAEAKAESPSQRLRRHIYALHLRKGGTPANFQQYYESMVDQFVAVTLVELDKL
jgi:hypothetical protein